MLEFRGVSKTYGRAAGGRVEALVDLSFEVKPAELAVVVGPSGAGKSTLLRLVTGEESPTRGAVLVEGTEVGTLGGRSLARLRRSLGIMPQAGRLLPDRTALGNLTFVLRAFGAGRAEARDRALAALTETGAEGPAPRARRGRAPTDPARARPGDPPAAAPC
jgi:D-methionine transport system ATP-binding protein